MAYFCLFESVPLANEENSSNPNGVCSYVRAVSFFSMLLLAVKGLLMLSNLVNFDKQS